MGGPSPQIGSADINNGDEKYRANPGGDRMNVTDTAVKMPMYMPHGEPCAVLMCKYGRKSGKQFFMT